nr:uncharacterized protein LOC117685770 [Crassostrea gigas]
MMKTVLIVFSYLCCIASCCQRRDDAMVCQELLSSPRLEGVKVLTKQLNLRAYDMEKVMVQFSDLQCDEILPRPGTKVFFGDRLCTHASTARQKSYPSTTTAMMETAAIGFRNAFRILEVSYMLPRTNRDSPRVSPDPRTPSKGADTRPRS